MRQASGYGNIKWILIAFFLCQGLGPRVGAQEILTLEHAMEIAHSNSPNIKSTQLNLERSRQLLNAQQAALKSRFSLTLTPFNFSRVREFDTFFSTWFTNETRLSTGSFSIQQPIRWTDGTVALINQLSWRDSRTERPDFTFPGTGQTTLIQSKLKTYNNNLYLSFQQPLFTYNRTQLALHELELDLEQTALSYGIQSLELERQVAQNFYDVYLKKAGLDIAVEELHNQEQSYQIIKNKVEAGLAAQEEFYQAELNLATSNSQVQNQQVIYANALDVFKQLIGISLFDSAAVIADVSYQSVPIDLQKALEHGLNARMELRQRQIDIDLAQADLVRASSLNEFKADLSLTYGLFGESATLNDVYQSPTRNQQLLMSLEIPLWDWGEKKSRIRASEAVVAGRKLSLAEEKNTIIIGIRQAFRALENQKIQIEIARQNVRNAELTYDINLERYKNGDLTSMDLNLFQTQLSQKKYGLIEALINYRLALLNMKIQSLWDFERNMSALPALKLEPEK